MMMENATRVGILTWGTALVVANVRHGLQTNWAAWEGLSAFLGSWLIHTIALYFLVAVARSAISRWHKFFLGNEHELVGNDTEFQYYVVTTIFVAAVTICVGFVIGPFLPTPDD